MHPGMGYGFLFCLKVVMKILIVSDSHGMNGPLRAAIMKEAPDMLIHLGDAEYSTDEIAKWAGSPKTPCVFVRGNCDASYYCSSDVRNEAVFELKGHKIFCCHGHRQRVNYGLLSLSLTAQEQGCDIVMFGHTHVPYDSFGDALTDYSRLYAFNTLSRFVTAFLPNSEHLLISWPLLTTHSYFGTKKIKSAFTVLEIVLASSLYHQVALKSLCFFLATLCSPN